MVLEMQLLEQKMLELFMIKQWLKELNQLEYLQKIKMNMEVLYQLPFRHMVILFTLLSKEMIIRVSFYLDLQNIQKLILLIHFYHLLSFYQQIMLLVINLNMKWFLLLNGMKKLQISTDFGQLMILYFTLIIHHFNLLLLQILMKSSRCLSTNLLMAKKYPKFKNMLIITVDLE